MSLLGLYHPTPSLLHRLPAGLKLAALLVAAIGLFLIPYEIWLIAAAVGCLLLYAVGRIPVRLVWAQLKPIAFVVLFVSVPSGFSPACTPRS
ncbi:hypothetical protein [Fodinicola feengrottensis]|uniref:hypothetical protein n=1 Tax=Fodinicola feengrottensis TaxID=435914 RepID=UPI0024433E87|nr:hypothetical protein [Fodinicola feengrottensis]